MAGPSLQSSVDSFPQRELEPSLTSSIRSKPTTFKFTTFNSFPKPALTLSSPTSTTTSSSGGHKSTLEFLTLGSPSPTRMAGIPGSDISSTFNQVTVKPVRARLRPTVVGASKTDARPEREREGKNETHESDRKLQHKLGRHVVLAISLAVVWRKVIRPRRRKLCPFSVGDVPAGGTLAVEGNGGTIGAIPQWPREKRGSRGSGMFTSGPSQGVVPVLCSQEHENDSTIPTRLRPSPHSNDSSGLVAEDTSTSLPTRDGPQQLENELIVTVLQRLAAIEAVVAPLASSPLVGTASLREVDRENQPPGYVLQPDYMSGRARASRTGNTATGEPGTL
ncbi:hypothetical protein P691DRAFT_842954 [Macrolepiota fuliginosa MF-IS2]|uniref:Uncharacterized protein n=1 Tax=Macrolepiota fuliginosa MF-IS2 TaxID=1400762 RepID=A0A9P5XJQ5_9AGAR|nr:hypothetical protein P691DRAFT_842954 [Macrolepiota fuliginosa MF-IS2]